MEDIDNLRKNMNTIVPVVGRLVYSTSGRDSGKYFIIYKIVDQNFVLILDGYVHKLKKPKLKKLKHLKLKDVILVKIAQKLEQDATVFDGEIKSALRQCMADIEENKA